MSFNRLQKLLFSEYCDFEDMVLLESPFAQTTKEGKGIRQVHLGLTPTKLVLATDVLTPIEYVNCRYVPGLDPEIETFELIAIYPVECVTLSVYRKRQKQAIKARFCNNKVLYFELGGFERRAMFWNLWCEKVKFLCPSPISNSSRSETSVATSSTASTLYLLNKKFITFNGNQQIWCRFGTSRERCAGKWTDKHLFLGKNFDGTTNFKPALATLTNEEFVSENTLKKPVEEHRNSLMEERGLNFGDIVKVNRFGKGINEGCNQPLYLSVDDYLIPKRYSTVIKELQISKVNSEDFTLNLNQFAEKAVLEWEFYKVNDINKYNKNNKRHKRRYGFQPMGHLMYGYNPLIPPAEPKYSLQLKRVNSEVNLREIESNLPIEKNLLKSSISEQFLKTFLPLQPGDILRKLNKPNQIFWTTKRDYQPKSSKESYDELRKYLGKIKNHQTKKKKKKIFKKLKNYESESDVSEPYDAKRQRKRKKFFMYSMFSGKINVAEERNVFNRQINLNNDISMWNFTSTTLAEHLTLLERDFFVKIPTEELEILVIQKSARNAPNLSALLAFSHRISCLIASEILKNDTQKARARLIARFINTANKCHRMANFQSCKTIILGLQSPGIYRLRETWAYLRKKHATKYQIFEILCRLYRDARLPIYQKTFHILSQSPPFLPYISDILSRVLGKVPEFGNEMISKTPSFATTKTSNSNVEAPSNLNKSNLIMKLYRVFKPDEETTELANRKKSKRKKPLQRRIKFKSLSEYYTEQDSNLYDNLDVTTNLMEAQKYMEKCQLGAVNYNFNADDAVKEYLLGARYGEDKKNFYKSLIVESPCSLYETM